jgi:hypothetical protein
VNLLEESVVAARTEEEEFRRLLPQDGFVGDYMVYTDRQESPGSFHFWTGITILSACLQRRVWVCKGIYNVYPNLFTILVAPSGRCRKTRAMSLGVELIDGFDWLNLIADKTSPEAMLEALMVGTKTMSEEVKGMHGPAVDSTGFITIPELAVFLGKENYNSGMTNLLTDLYDCRDSFRYITRNSRPVVLRNIALQMLGCTTPDWFGSALPTNAFGGGFMSRFVFVVKKQRDRSITFPESPPPDMKHNLKKLLLQIRARVHGKITFSPAAFKWFDEWYKSTELEMIDDINLMGFVERKPDTILKVATLLAASEMTTELSQPTLERALHIVEWSQSRAFEAFKHVNLTAFGMLRRRILDFVECNGGVVTRRQVLRKFAGQLPNGIRDLEAVEAVMQEAQEVAVKAVNTSGRPRIEYRMVYGGRDDD